MPVIKKPRNPESSRHSELVAALAAELARGALEGPTEAPQIIEEEQRGNYLHVTVIWDAWTDVAHEDRGRIIMDAYAQRRPTDVNRITLALGLTKAEAERLGVHA